MRGPSDWHLCISHKRRKYVNEAMQTKAAAEYQKQHPGRLVVRLTPPEATSRDQNEAQAFDLFTGTKLIGCNSEHTKILNGDVLLITGVTQDAASLFNEDAGETFELKHAALLKHTRLRWAITITAAQGRTLRGTVTLWDINSRFFTSAHLYVASSRCTSGCLFQVAA